MDQQFLAENTDRTLLQPVSDFRCQVVRVKIQQAWLLYLIDRLVIETERLGALEAQERLVKENSVTNQRRQHDLIETKLSRSECY